MRGSGLAGVFPLPLSACSARQQRRMHGRGWHPSVLCVRESTKWTRAKTRRWGWVDIYVSGDRQQSNRVAPIRSYDAHGVSLEPTTRKQRTCNGACTTITMLLPHTVSLLVQRFTSDGQTQQEVQARVTAHTSIRLHSDSDPVCPTCASRENKRAGRPRRERRYGGFASPRSPAMRGCS